MYRLCELCLLCVLWKWIKCINEHIYFFNGGQVQVGEIPWPWRWTVARGYSLLIHHGSPMEFFQRDADAPWEFSVGDRTPNLIAELPRALTCCQLNPKFVTHCLGVHLNFPLISESFARFRLWCFRWTVQEISTHQKRHHLTRFPTLSIRLLVKCKVKRCRFVIGPPLHLRLSFDISGLAFDGRHVDGGGLGGHAPLRPLPLSTSACTR